MTDILDFFELVICEQIHLTAIHPDQARPTSTCDFGTDVAGAAKWAQQQNSNGMNVYYTVNAVQPELNKKPAKADIVGYRFAHVDVDPPKGSAGWRADERDRIFEQIISGPRKPHVVIWSGNGWQALYRLSTDDADEEQLEAINRGLIAFCGGDKGTHNADRLLRVPGLINYPSELKRKWGRTDQQSFIKFIDEADSYNAADLLCAFPPPSDPSQARKEIELGEVLSITADDLGLPEDAYLRKLIEHPEGNDRSSDIFHFACEALKQGFTTDQVAGVLLNGDNPISEHCFDQPDPERAARRAITAALKEDEVRVLARAHERERERASAAGEDARPSDETKLWILETMLRDCVLLEEGAMVADVTRPGMLLSSSDFRASTAASIMHVMVAGKNNSQRKSKKKVAEIWLEHPARRTVATTTFRPGAQLITTDPNGKSALNTWRGYRFRSPPDNWAEIAEPFVEHVRWLWGNDADLFLDWLAHLAQKPGELPSIAWLHIAQRTGMGRNWIASVLGRVFVGYAALAFDLSGTLRNGYNGLLAGKVLAVVDEIDEGSGTRKYQVQQELKQLVTEETRTINPKYGRQHVEFNVCRWLIFSNSTTALPLEDDDRRFCVVQCNEGPKGQQYYSHLYKLRDQPDFIASVAEYLSRRDISNFNSGQRAPNTAAKTALLQRTRSEDEQMLHELRGRWPVDIITSVELHQLMGEGGELNRHALRYALERAGIVKITEWKSSLDPQGPRKKVAVYAVRNAKQWEDANPTALRAEINRYDLTMKGAIFDSNAHDLI